MVRQTPTNSALVPERRLHQDMVSVVPTHQEVRLFAEDPDHSDRTQPFFVGRCRGRGNVQAVPEAPARCRPETFRQVSSQREMFGSAPSPATDHRFSHPRQVCQTTVLRLSSVMVSGPLLGFNSGASRSSVRSGIQHADRLSRSWQSWNNYLQWIRVRTIYSISIFNLTSDS